MFTSKSLNRRHLYLPGINYKFISNRTMDIELGQPVDKSTSKIGNGDTVIDEGKASILQPGHVFYNPVQEFNRDLTIAVISEFTKQAKAKNEQSRGLTILEALAATGLRSVRFAMEIPDVEKIIANDLDSRAVEYISHNIARNGVAGKLEASCNDASLFMYMNRSRDKQFDVIDLDPYGSAAPFLDAAVRAVRDEGLLCVTCTDMSILCGNSPETCYAKYTAVPLKAKFCHEMALRILLRAIELNANRYGRYIRPLVSLSADFYIRVFVQVFSGQLQVKDSVMKVSTVYHCRTCGFYHLQPIATRAPTEANEKKFKYTPAHSSLSTDRCHFCGSRYFIGGPVWTAPLYDTQFVTNLLTSVCDDPARFNTSDRITGILSVVLEELADVPFYYLLDDLCSILHLSVPPMKVFRSAIMNAGYDVSFSHAAKGSVKTTMPLSHIWDILKCWAKDHPINQKHMKVNTPIQRIMSVEPQLDVDFTMHPDAIPESQRKGLLRWQANPERNWGPKPRAKKGANLSVDELRLKGEEKAEQRRRKRKLTDPLDYKQFECKKFKEGLCDLGDRCRYSHVTCFDGQGSSADVGGSTCVDGQGSSADGGVSE